jgi:guanylate kinase
MMRQSLSASSPARRNWRRFASNPKILSKKFSRRGILFVVSAPSGAGKTTLVERIRRTPNLFYSVSCTTRTPRAGELDGQDYRFLSDADFRERVAKGDFVEYAQVHGDHYGTLREPIVTNLETGKDVLIDIDTQGAAVIRNCGDPLIQDALADVFIMPPDLEELRKRLLKRGTETAQQIDSRLATAAREMEHWRDYRYTIISGSVEKDLQRFRQIMEAESYLSRRLIEK